MKNFIVFILFLALTLPVFSISDEADITYNVGWTEKLGEKIDFNAEITSSNNLTKKFKDFVDPNKPTVLILAYYSCPKMCTFLLDGVLEVVNLINNTLVRDYIVEKVEIFYTHHKSYRAYVKIKVSKDNVSLVIEEIKADKKLVQNNKKKQNKLTSKVKEVLKNFD